MGILYHFLSLISHLKTFIEIKVFQKRFFLLHTTGKKFRHHLKTESILVIIPHVVVNAHSFTSDKLERITKCLDSLLSSVASYNTRIILLSKENCSIHHHLPPYLKDKVEMMYSSQEDPMFVEFDAHEIFREYIDQYDYFLFLEDDILLTDSWFLEKIKKFNSISPYPEYVLLPHRFEYYKGVKYYLDQMAVTGEVSKRYTFSPVFNLSFDDVKFCMYENPHAAFYCLTRKQMKLWIESGYKWKNKVVAFGTLESAATFGLFENFKFLKPHPDDMDYFQIQHFGNKYILNDHVLIE